MKLVEPYTFNKGRITIFKREGALKGTWHYRLRIRGRAKSIFRSAKTTDREEAIRIAETQYEDISYLVRHGREVATDMKFSRLWTMFCSAHQVQQSSVHRRKHYEGNGTRYFVPFLGDKRVSAISDSVVDDYWRWRLEFWSKRSDAPANAKLLPSNKTLQMEAQMLKQVFRWALRKGYLHRELFVVPPQPGEKHSRRPAFSSEEWTKLRAYLDQWTLQEQTPTSGPHAMWAHHRAIFKEYVLFMANSGLRPNEARQLRWSHKEDFRDTRNQRRVEITVTAGKTGGRKCIPTEDAPRYLDRLRELSTHTEDSDYIFCFEDGKPISVSSMSTKFARFLKDAKLEFDNQGKRRTLYSLRHTYATFRLLDEHVDYLTLARNMGTSVEMIERHYSHVQPRQVAHALGKKNARKLDNEFSVESIGGKNWVGPNS